MRLLLFRESGLGARRTAPEEGHQCDHGVTGSCNILQFFDHIPTCDTWVLEDERVFLVSFIHPTLGLSWQAQSWALGPQR